jgi:arylformamidase
MQVVDLSHRIHSSMPIFPGSQSPLIEKIHTMAVDGFNETQLNLFSHIGTHLDAPGHMIDGGRMLDQLPINSFVGKAWVVDVSQNPKPNIMLNDLIAFEEEIRQSAFLLFNTGWGHFWGMEKYFQSFPVLSNEAAQWLCARRGGWW